MSGDAPSPTQEHLTLEGLLADFDKIANLCPRPLAPICPRCGATAEDGCGAWNVAAVNLEAAIRRIVSARKDGSSPQQSTGEAAQ